MPTFTTVPTFAPDYVVPASDLNVYLRDDMEALATRPQQHISRAANYTLATTTTWLDIDSTNLKILVTPSRTNATIRVSALINLSHSAAGLAALSFYVDSTTRYILWQASPVPANATGYYIAKDIAALSAAQHDIRLQWYTTAATLSADGVNYPIQFDAIEIGIP